MIYDINQLNNHSFENNSSQNNSSDNKLIKKQLKNKIKLWIKSFLKIVNEYKRYIEPIKKNQKGGNLIINNYIDKYNLNIIKKDKIENKKLLILNNLKGKIKIKKDKKDIEIIKLKNKLSEL